MCVVKDSAEHELLTRLEELKSGAHGWACAYFSANKPRFNPRAATSIIQAMNSDDAMRPQDELAALTDGATQDIYQRHIYVFPDGDVIFLGCVDNDKKYEDVKKALTGFSKKNDLNYFSFGMLQNEFRVYQKRAKEKMMAAKLYEAYGKMADESRVSSLTARRRMRDEPLVMIIEDDRFSGSYATSILIKEYDTFLCKTGEEGVCAYIDHAPDIVFIDIHLPGISGHETLDAIKMVDPDAFAIMLSADAVKDNIVMASEGGARSFLKKPVSKERLLSVVKTSPYVCGMEGVKAEIIVNN